jgi:hypothetical protein
VRLVDSIGHGRTDGANSEPDDDVELAKADLKAGVERRRRREVDRIEGICAAKKAEPGTAGSTGFWSGRTLV